MTAPNVINRGESTSLIALVREAATLEIPVPKSVSDELKLHTRLERDPLGAQSELQAAHAALSAAPADKVDPVLEALAKAALQTLAAQALADMVGQITVARLRNSVYDQLTSWEGQAVELFNAAVERHGLNDPVASLPDLTQVSSPIDLSAAHSQAVQIWRDAVDELHPLFSFYTRIATINGEEVGPSDADGFSTNLSLACRLGDPGSFHVAQNAAIQFASIGANSGAARQYGRLAPFCIPAMCGYKLHLSTSENAVQIRRAIQPAAVTL